MEGDWSRKVFTPWREGQHPASVLGIVEVYVSTMGVTPVRPGSVLSYYTRAEQDAWWAGIPAAIKDGEPWPTEAPWTELALARKAYDDEQMRAAINALSSKLEPYIGGAA